MEKQFDMSLNLERWDNTIELFKNRKKKRRIKTRKNERQEGRELRKEKCVSEKERKGK